MSNCKRPLTTSAFLDCGCGDSSSDSDFDIERELKAHASSESDSDTDSASSNSDTISDSAQTNAETKKDLKLPVAAAAACSEMELQQQQETTAVAADMCASVPPQQSGLGLNCGVCLNDDCYMEDGMLECDNCGVSVHELCYGDVDYSSPMPESTPKYWFCEACCAGVTAPDCELCPHKGGLYKATDVGRWVHLVCALYVPRVKFYDVEKLSPVTLTEMPQKKWGERACMFCQDTDYARTGVCIGCDAGLCKSYFHVTCAQAAGLLVEAREEDAEAADPLYAQCHLHTDRHVIKKRKRSYQLWCHHMQTHQRPNDLAVERELQQCRRQFAELKNLQTTDMPTPSTSHAPQAKAQVLRLIDTAVLTGQAESDAAKATAANKLYMAPDFNVDFVHFCLNRNERIQRLKQEISDLELKKVTLANQLTETSAANVKAEQQLELVRQTQHTLHETISMLHRCVCTLHSGSALPTIDCITSARSACQAQKSGGNAVEQLNATLVPIGSPKAASQPDTTTAERRNCTKCQRYENQDLLVKCDVCKRCYHLDCLQPPLSQLPKRSKSCDWQCAKCNTYTKIVPPVASEPDEQK